MMILFFFFFDHARGSQQYFQFLNAAFDESLLIFGGLIFGVLDQFPAFHRFMQAVSNFLTLNGAQVLKFVLKLLKTFLCQEFRGHNTFLTKEFASCTGCNWAPFVKAGLIYHDSKRDASAALTRLDGLPKTDAFSLRPVSAYFLAHDFRGIEQSRELRDVHFNRVLPDL